MDVVNRWHPERVFYSHASCDDRLTAAVQKALQYSGGYEVYIAERGMVGKPLMDKLREELVSCNAILVGWTKNGNRKRTSEIVSFELGMAFSLGLPIYLLRLRKAKMPWFFDRLTDYTGISAPTDSEVKRAIASIEPFSFCHPIDVTCPSEAYSKGSPPVSASENLQVVQPDGTILLPADFEGILHFRVSNRRPRSERDVRLLLQFPAELSLSFDAGVLDGNAIVQRNDVFYMWPRQNGVELHWPSLAARDFIFELRVKTPAGQTPGSSHVTCLLSSENLVEWRSKQIPVRWCQEQGRVG
jgi:hypothetical protein